MLKNVQTITQLHSFHMLARKCSKSFKLGFEGTWTKNFQMYQLDLEKTEEPEINCILLWIIEKAGEFQNNIYFCFIDYATAFNCVDHDKLWNILKEMGIPKHLTCLLRNLHAGQEVTVWTGHATNDWLKICKNKPNKKATKAVYFHPVELICRVVQSPSHVLLFVIPWTATCQTSLPLTISQSLPKFISIASVVPSNHLIFCCHLLLFSTFLSISVLSNELAVCIRWPKYWSFNISPSNEHLGLISKLTSLIYLQSKGPSSFLSSTTVQNTSYEILGWMKHKLE